MSIPKDGQSIKGAKRHPTVEDDVTIYAEATIMGDITIGKGSVIGGNVWLTDSVAPFSLVYNKSEMHVRNDRFQGEVEDFVI